MWELRTGGVSSFQLVVARAQERTGLFQILPGVALALGASEQERRVESRDEPGALEIVDAAAEARDGIVAPEQRLGRERAERHDHLRPDRGDLLKQERLALLDFVRLGVAVAGRAALDDVGDVDLVARQVDRL